MDFQPDRRVTSLGAGNASARTGFASQARLTSLLALRMITDMRRGSRLAERACDRKMQLAGIDEIGSSDRRPLRSRLPGKASYQCARADELIVCESENSPGTLTSTKPIF